MNPNENSFDDRSAASGDDVARQQRLSDADAGLLAGQIANVAAAGLPLSSGLRALSEEVPSAKIRRWLREISERLERGQSLNSVSREATGAWPRYFLAMLEAGQRTGRLSEMLNDCVAHLRQTADVKRQLWTAVVYPMTLILAAWALLSFLMTWVMPQFKSIFTSFGTELPGMTVLFFSLSDSMQWAGWWSLPALIAGVIALWQWSESLGWEKTRDRWVSHVPLFGEARRAAALGEFCRLLSLLVRYRIPLPDSIRLAAGSIRDADLRTICFDVAMRVDSGQSLTQAASATGRFPSDLLHLFQWADKGDDFADGLQTASDVLSAQSRVHSHTLAVITEPAVTILVGGTVGMTVISCFLPLFKLLNDLS